MAVSPASSSSSLSSMLGVSGKGIGGLATGLDTDSLVNALTSGTKLKISKQGQQKQLLNWKMTAYRSMSTALTAFQSKALQYTAGGNTNIASNAFFNTFKATSSSSKVSVTTNKESIVSSFNISKVQQLASAETLASKTKLSTTLSMDNMIEGKEMGNVKAFTGQTLSIDVDGDVKTIQLDKLNDAIRTTTGNTLDIDKFKTGLQDIITTAFGTKTVNGVSGIPRVAVGLDADNKIKLDSDAGKIIIASNSSLLGVDEGDTNRIDTSKTKISQIDAFKNVQGELLKFNINGKEISVSKDETLDALMSKIKNSDAGVTMTYSKFTDQFTLTSKTTGGGQNIVLSDVQGNLMNQIFGAKSGGSVGTDFLITGNDSSSQKKNQIKVEGDASSEGLTPGSPEMIALGKQLKSMEFQMTINGVTKYVKADPMKVDSTKLAEGKFTIDDVYTAINKGIQNAFTGTSVEFVRGADGKTKIMSDPMDPEAFSISSDSNFGAGSLMDLVGITSSIGNTNMSMGYKPETKATANLTNAPLAAGIEEGIISVTIDGVTKDLHLKKEDLDNIRGGGNAQYAEYLNENIKYEFGAEAAKKVIFTAEHTYKTVDTMKAKLDVDGHPILDGDGKPELENVYVLDSEGNPTSEKATHQEVDTTKLSFFTDGTTSVKIGSPATVTSTQADLYSSLGFAKDAGKDFTTNRGTTGVTLGQLRGVDGNKITNVSTDNKTLTISTDGGAAKSVSYNKDTTLQGLMEQINDAFGGSVIASVKNGQLSIAGKSGDIKVVDTGEFLKNLTGINNKVGSDYVYETAAANTTAATSTKGNYAEVVIDGAVVSRPTNTFDYNGATITVNEVSAAGDAPIKIDISSDPSDVVKRITDWMTDYNALVYTLNAAINETKNGDYSPLTDEQKADMTQDQIKTWEAEAKKGLLRSDSTLRGILGEMRSTFFEKVEASGISLFDIGIVTKINTGDINQAGQLEFDTVKNSQGTGEERLRKMLETSPDKVRLLFTDTDNGIGAKLNGIIDRAARTSSTNRGSLVRIAGTEILTADNSSQLGKQISAVDKYVAQLKERMESQHNRYWKRFSALEMAVQKMNSQSSWLNQ